MDPSGVPKPRSRKILIAVILLVLIITGIYLLGGTSAPVTQSRILTDTNFAKIAALLQANNPFVGTPASDPTRNIILLAFNTSPAFLLSINPSSSSQTKASPSINWNASTPSVRCATLLAFLNLGTTTFPENASANLSSTNIDLSNQNSACTPSNWDAIKKHYLFDAPLGASDAVSLYELVYLVEMIKMQANHFGTLFNCDMFSNSSAASERFASYMQINLSSGDGPAAYYLTSQGSRSHDLAPYEKMKIETSFYWMTLLQMSPNLQTLFDGGSIGCKNSNALSPDAFFYTLALDEYAPIQLSEVLYNSSIQPGIAYLSYLNGTLLVNAGNIDPTVVGATVSVDDLVVNYTQYYNFFISKIPLSVGNHTLKIAMQGGTLTKAFYVNPGLYIDSILLSHSTGNLSIRIVNPSYDSINLSAGFLPSSIALKRGESYTHSKTVIPEGPVSLNHYEFEIDLNTSQGPAHYFLFTRAT